LTALVPLSLVACAPTSVSPPSPTQAPLVSPSPRASLPLPSPTPCVSTYAQPEMVLEFVPPANLAHWAFGDFNADGFGDILVTRGDWQSPEDFGVDVLLGDDMGGLSMATEAVFAGSIPRTQFPGEIVVSDFNGDGRPDVFIADSGDDRNPWPGYQNALILSAPQGGLVNATANLPQQSDSTHSATVADIDNDGDTDIYVGNIYGGMRVPPQILLNDGTGRFTVAEGLLPSAQADLGRNKYTASLFADVNNDGYPDLLLGADDFTVASAVLINDGTGHFSLLSDAMPAKPFAPTDIALDIASADLNGDNYQDLLISWTKGNPSYMGRYIQVLMNDHDGTFTDETQSRLPPPPYLEANWWSKFTELVDVDEDGDLDILAHVALYWAVANQPVYLNDGAGHFAPSTSALPLLPNSLCALTDLDADGHRDLVCKGRGSDDTSERYYVGRRLACP